MVLMRDKVTNAVEAPKPDDPLASTKVAKIDSDIYTTTSHR